MTDTRDDGQGRRWGIACVLVGVLMRSAVMLPDLGEPLDDPDNYLPLARALSSGEGLSFQGRPTAYRPPLYPLVLSPLVRLPGSLADWSIRALHLALGAGTVGLTYRCGRRWGYGTRRAAFAASIVALDPVLVSQARSVMTETLAAFLLVLSATILAGAGRVKTIVLGGVAFGLCALCRPSLLPVATLSVPAAACLPPGSARDRIARAALLGLAIVGTLSPWAIRNWRVLGEPVWTTTHGGYTLGLANNAAYYDAVLGQPPGTVWSGPTQDRWWSEVNRRTAGMTEPQSDRALRAEALRFIRERPGDFVRATLARLGRFWGICPSGNVYPAWLRLSTAAWTLPLWVMLIAGLARRGLWRWPGVLAPAALIGLTAVHAFYWTDLRMRAPLVPMIALIAAGFWPGAPRRLSLAEEPKKMEN